MMPSPVNLSTKPSKCSTPSARMLKKRCMISDHASASICSASSIEPFTSANSTVTCLRSPSRALREVRIFSARCLGVEVADLGGAVAGPAVSATPQPPQNFSPGWFEAPHAAQIAASTAPHSAQYRRSARLSWSQDGHRIAYRLACGDYHEGLECQNEQQSLEADALAGNGTPMNTGCPALPVDRTRRERAEER